MHAYPTYSTPNYVSYDFYLASLNTSGWVHMEQWLGQNSSIGGGPAVLEVQSSERRE